MASSMALRRLAGGILRPRGGVTLSALAPAATRSSPSSFNTTNHLALGSRHYTTIYSYSGIFGSRSPTGDAKFPDNHFMQYQKPRGGDAGTVGNIKEDEEGLHLKADMPGLGKEDVVVFIDDNQYLVIMDKKTYESYPSTPRNVEELTHTSYFGCIKLEQKCYKADKTKASMKNGQLKVTVPKLKLNEREDLLFVKVV